MSPEAYLSEGWAPIPLRALEKKPPAGFHLARWLERTAKKADVRRWWKRWPDANVGLVMGAPSGNLLAVDVDPRNGGERSLRGLHLPPTRVVRTGSGGWHYVYRSRTSLPKRTGALPGLDIIGAGGYIVAPPSIHPNGNSYAVELDEKPTPAPAWIEELLRSIPKQTSPKAQAAWSAVILEGERNERLFRAACGFAEGRCFLCGKGRCQRGDTEHLLRRLSAMNRKRCSPPLEEDEVRGIAAKAWRYAHRTAPLPPATPTARQQRNGRNRAPLHRPLHGKELFGRARSEIELVEAE